MQNYEVVIKVTEKYCMEVKANTEDQAIEMGWRLIRSEEGRAEHWADDDSEVFANEQ